MKTILKTTITLIFSIIFLFIIFVNVNAQEKGHWEILNESGSFKTIDFVNDQVGWIAGEGKLLKTNDGGDTWISLTIDPNWNFNKVDFINENVGWGSAVYWDRISPLYSDNDIIKSEDGGQTWTIQSRYSLDRIYAIDERIVYGIDGNQILKTTDGGHNWNSVRGNYPDSDYSSVWFFNKDLGIVTGYDRDTDTCVILHTSNGGNSWQIIDDLNLGETSNLQFINDSSGYLLSTNENYESSIYCTSDTGNSWTVITENRFPIDCFHFFDKDKVVAIVSDSLWYKSLMMSNNGGITWVENFKLSEGQWRLWNSMYFYNSNLGFLISLLGPGRGGTLGDIFYQSTDGGNNWNISQITYPFKDVYFIDRNLGFFSGGVSEWHGGWGDLYKTYDGGKKLYISFRSRDEVKSVFFTGPNLGYILSTQTDAGTGTNIFKTTNSGMTWDSVYADVSDSTEFYFAGKKMYFLNENSGWVAGAGFDNDSSGAAFLYTNDGGETWDVSWIVIDSDLYHHSLNSIHFVDPTTGWAVGEFGLIVKYTEKDKWQVIPSITDLPLRDVFFSDENHGWIAGGYLNEQDFQSILLKTTSGGVSWQEKRFHEYLINDMFFEDSLIGYAVGNDTNRIDDLGSWQADHGRGVLLKTIDGGENWIVEVDELSASLTAIYFEDGCGWAVGETGLILRYDGVSWVDQNTGKTYPSKFNLSQNYPNPFNPSTKIKFALPKAEKVKIDLYNTLGQRVDILLNQHMRAGQHEVEFNAENLSSGIYYYRIDAGEFQGVKKMILIK